MISIFLLLCFKKKSVRKIDSLEWRVKMLNEIISPIETGNRNCCKYTNKSNIVPLIWSNLFYFFISINNRYNEPCSDQRSQTTVLLMLCVNGVKTESKYQSQTHRETQARAHTHTQPSNWVDFVWRETCTGRKQLNSTMTLAVFYSVEWLSFAIKLCIHLRFTSFMRTYLSLVVVCFFYLSLLDSHMCVLIE